MATDVMNAFNIAMSRAAIGLDWSYPCLIWVADYVRDATGVDFAARWRGLAWNEHVARRELAMLSRSGDGVTAVERAMSGMAATYGWQSCDSPRQGAVMIGCYAGEDVGIPAIFDGDTRWLMAGEGLARITRAMPGRAWELPCAT